MSSDEKMTPEEWLRKAEWEGGIAETVTSYGLTHNDLDDSDPEFKEAIRQVVEVAAPLLVRAEDLACAYEE